MRVQICGLALTAAILAKFAIGRLRKGPVLGNETLNFNLDGPIVLTDKQLQFLSAYTGCDDLESLRQHVLLVWQEVCAEDAFECFKSGCMTRVRNDCAGMRVRAWL